ncbi:MAG: hypothetical protein MJ252_16415 [archaeon]|nr:hypothetical protein [archaeon]
MSAYEFFCQNPNKANSSYFSFKSNPKNYYSKTSFNKTVNIDSEETESESFTFLPYHRHDTKCFQSCSDFSLTISAKEQRFKGNKFSTVSKTTINGKIQSPLKVNLGNNFHGVKIAMNYDDCLPIKMKDHQQFALDNSYPKLPLNMEFNISDQEEDYSSIDEKFMIRTFELDLNGKVHGKKCFENGSINFSVKGYDIMKAILYWSADFCYSKEYSKMLNSKFVDLQMIPLKASVWSTDVCSLAVSFLIPFGSLKKINGLLFNKYFCNVIKNYLLNSYSKVPPNALKTINQLFQTHLNQQGIRNTKIFFTYNLPLTVFDLSYVRPNYSEQQLVNYKNISQFQEYNPYYQSQEYFQMDQYHFMNQKNIYFNYVYNQTQLPLLNNCTQLIYPQSQSYYHLQTEQPIKTSHENFCNFNLFMTATTPLIFETENVKMKDIFKGFIKPSLFGITMTFKLDENIFTNVKYFPYLNTLGIALEDGVTIQKISPESSSINPTNISLNTEYSSSNDNSFLGPKSIPDDRNSVSETLVNFVNFKEKEEEIYFKKNLIENLENINKEYPGFEDLTLKEIKEGSYFSIIWFPKKIFKPTEDFGNCKFVESEKHSILEVIYRIKGNTISNTGKELKVIGIVERNPKGIIINTLGVSYFDKFWFTNVSNHKNEFYYEQDMNSNKEIYMRYLSNYLSLNFQC